MALVKVQGTFLQASLKQSEFDGKKNISVQLDVYQPTSPAQNKTVSIKCDDVDMLQKFQTDYAMGSMIEVMCTVAAYKNQAYYKFQELAF